MPDSALSEEDRKRLRDVETGIAALRERTHAQNNGQMKDASLAQMLQRIHEQLTQVAVKQEVVPKPLDQLTKVWAPIGGLVMVAIVIVGALIAYGRQDAAMVARLAALETWKQEAATALGKVQSLETGVDMARRIRDQQQQGLNDRLVGLERSDKDDRDALNRVLQTLATITAQLQSQGGRVEELLRRQDRLENRLGARPGSDEPEQPTALRMVPLVWRSIVN